MPAKRKLSQRQLEILLEFAESHQEIALGRFCGGPLSNQATKQAWEAIALQLNAVADGITKTPDQWRRYWIEFKAKVKAKAADVRRSASATGGGRSKLIPLSDFDQRVLALLGPVAVEGLPGVRIPVELPSTSTTPQPSPDVLSPAMEVEWLDEAMGGTASEEVEQELVQCGEPPVDSEPHYSEPIPEQTSRVIAEESTAPAPAVQVPHNIRRPRAQRQIRRHEGVPRWAYELEERRIAIEESRIVIEERLARVEERRAASMETIVNLLTVLIELIRERNFNI
ncbi:unnamed protein product [Diatraea saccharalis]|uniref:Regulatory protein zeste n=1 Tax=Diatraea saccharalis TaxID=40085 RepID=A0A9N9QVQ8_9NEOP|nr:unnamed protein product [Diatraea saccharalis]CAG9789367.1 unnamed protein product [Diatraea saccharalis]CAG9793538.1 unnamed protein product [Diatraea saccharalis]